MTDIYLVRKLEQGALLDAADFERIRQLVSDPVTVESGSDLVREGNTPRDIHFITGGAACRYKILPDGRRAIVALLMPGDFCDLHVDLLGHMDHSIGALTDCTFSRVAAVEVDAVLLAHPAIGRACRRAELVEAAILREWVVNVGRRSSEQQLAHLFCEFYLRMNSVGLTHDHHFRMPFTQVALGDMLGITSVHVQRTMSRLREDGLITLQRREIHIINFEKLAERGDFDPGYLHLHAHRH